jgi:hypothetical protein
METCGVYSFKIDHSGSCGDCQIIEIEELSTQNHWKASEFASEGWVEKEASFTTRSDHNALAEYAITCQKGLSHNGTRPHRLTTNFLHMMKRMSDGRHYVYKGTPVGVSYAISF